MAANLQGIWNDSLAPPWDSKYTININTEMNYWPAEVTNLSELHEPLLRSDRQRQSRRPRRRQSALRRRRLRAAPQHRSLGRRRADRQAGVRHLADGRRPGSACIDGITTTSRATSPSFARAPIRR
jgi:hypothetical protein